MPENLLLNSFVHNIQYTAVLDKIRWITLILVNYLNINFEYCYYYILNSSSAVSYR